jgi:hypothetical protein
VKRVALGLVVLGALAVPALAHAGAPPIARPNPVTYPIRLDYQDALPGPDGKPATLGTLDKGVIMAATRDEAFLAFEKQDDLGGFVPAQIGRLTLTTGGHDILSPGTHAPQIPLFEQAAGGKVQSFTFTGAPPSRTPPPDNGNGSPSPPPPPTPGNTVPPANQGFGGQPTGSGGTTTTTTTSGGTTTTKRPPPPPTTTGATTTTPTTTTPGTTTTGTTTTTGGGGGGGSGGGGGGTSGCSGGSCASGSCGTPGIQIDSSPPGCVVSISNAAPGDSVSEVMTITNTTGAPYQLKFRAVGANNNHLWQDLELDVFDPLLGPSVPLPPLQFWLGSFHTLTTLAPGQTVQYEIEMYLPTTSGNADQGKSAVVTFDWEATG